MGRHIAIVDDDPINLKIAGKMLAKHEMKVSCIPSGKALLSFVKNNRPDLILLDILMPEMDGFETYEKLKVYEAESGIDEIPVVFLTADSDKQTEARGFDLGVDDFVRKPFDPDVLVKRVTKVLEKQAQINKYHKEATTDKLTGLLNKGAAIEKFTQLVRDKSGMLMMIDLDSFKLVNDLYGHDMGDEVLISFSKIITKALGENDVIGRMGGDEFSAFSVSVQSEEELKAVTEEINKSLVGRAKELMGEQMDIPLGASIGAVKVSGNAQEYPDMIKLADKALYNVKQNGKHGCELYVAGSEAKISLSDRIDLRSLSMLFSERNISNTALRLSKDDFVAVYRFVTRYIMRYSKLACKLLFTLDKGTNTSDSEYVTACEDFGVHLEDILRKSDLIMRYNDSQYFIMLTDVKEEAIQHITDHIIDKWIKGNSDVITISYEMELMKNEEM